MFWNSLIDSWLSTIFIPLKSETPSLSLTLILSYLLIWGAEEGSGSLRAHSRWLWKARWAWQPPAPAGDQWCSLATPPATVNKRGGQIKLDLLLTFYFYSKKNIYIEMYIHVYIGVACSTLFVITEETSIFFSVFVHTGITDMEKDVWFIFTSKCYTCSPCSCTLQYVSMLACYTAWARTDWVKGCITNHTSYI